MDKKVIAVGSTLEVTITKPETGWGYAVVLSPAGNIVGKVWGTWPEKAHGQSRELKFEVTASKRDLPVNPETGETQFIWVLD